MPILVSADTKAGVGPNNIFYFLDITIERVGLFFTLDTEKKINKMLEHADERLAEAESIIQDDDVKVLESVLIAYSNKVETASDAIMEIQDSKKRHGYLNSILVRTIGHVDNLTTMLDGATTEIQELVLETISNEKENDDAIIIEIQEIEDKKKEIQDKINELNDADVDVEEVIQIKTEVIDTEERDRLKAVTERKRIETEQAEKDAQLKVEQESLLQSLKEAEAQRIADQQRQATEKAQALQKCLSTNYSLSDLDNSERKALSTLNTEAAKSKSDIRVMYDTEISNVKSDGERQLTSIREAQRGFATNSALLKQIQDSTDRSVQDLEMRRDELLSTVDAALAQQISDIRTNRLQMEREASENICY